MNFVFPLAQAAVPIAGSSDSYPVRRIYCVGRNYAEHAKEMGFTGREPPFFFCKPADAVVPLPDHEVGKVSFPPMTENYQYEMELVVAIGQCGKSGKNIPVAEANEHIFGYAMGLDMTRRDLQLALREIGRPWELGKAFDQSAPISAIHRVAETGIMTQGAIWLKVNDVPKQKGDLKDLIWTLPEVISNLSGYFTLAPGDLIFTGTPAGVSKVQKGDVLVGGVDGLGELALVLV